MLQPLIIAHRGSSHHAPENTLAAFELAISDAADGIELDVRLAADGVPICIHDASLRRTAGRDLLVRNLTSVELAQVDVGSWFDAQHTSQRLTNQDQNVGAGLVPARAASDERRAGTSLAPTPNLASARKPVLHGGRTFDDERVPTLAEALRLCRDAEPDLRIYVEMKCDESEAASLARAVARVVAEAGDGSRIIAASFTLAAIRFVKNAHAGIETAALFEPESEPPATAGGSDFGGNDLITRALDYGASGLMLHDELATVDVIDAARRRGLPVTVWTIDDANRARSLAAADVQAIITNDPAHIRRVLASSVDVQSNTDSHPTAS